MKTWKITLALAVFLLLLGVERKLVGSRRFQNVKNAVEQPCSNLSTIDRVIVSLLA